MSETKIYDYYIKEDFNCAEAMIRAANDFYNLNLNEEEMKLVSGFGAGMGCGFVCGCLSADIAILGKIFVKERAHESDKLKKMCSMCVAEFEKKFKEVNCAALKQEHAEAQNRCLKLIEENFVFLKEFIAKQN